MAPLSDPEAHELIAAILRNEEPAFTYVKQLARWAFDKAEQVDELAALEQHEDAYRDDADEGDPYDVFGVRGLVARL